MRLKELKILLKIYFQTTRRINVGHYSNSQIAKLRIKILAKINKEIDIAIKNDALDDIFDKYGVTIEDNKLSIVITKRMKILVLGDLAGKLKDYQIAAKRKGIDPGNVEFIDYQQAKDLNAGRLKYSSEYSDIIIGPMPHKIEGMGDTTSLLALIEKNPNEYPKLIKAEANSKLKISITGFSDYLLRTRFYEAMA